MSWGITSAPLGYVAIVIDLLLVGAKCLTALERSCDNCYVAVHALLDKQIAITTAGALTLGNGLEAVAALMDHNEPSLQMISDALFGDDEIDEPLHDEPLPRSPMSAHPDWPCARLDPLPHDSEYHTVRVRRAARTDQLTLVVVMGAVA